MIIMIPFGEGYQECEWSDESQVVLWHDGT